MSSKPARRRRAHVACAAMLVALIATVGAACGGGSSGNDSGATKVVVIADRTGPLAAGVGSGFQGVQAFVDHAKNGRKIDITVYDSQSTPTGAQTQFRRAVGQKPMAIIYFGGSSALSASLSIIEGTNIPVFTVSAGDKLVDPNPAGSSLYMLAATGSQGVNTALNKLQSILKASSLAGSKIARVGYSLAFTDEQFAYMDTAVKQRGGQIVATERIDPGVSNFGAQAAAVARAEPDAVFLSMPKADAMTVSKALKTAGVDVPILVPTVGGAGYDEALQAINSVNYYGGRNVVAPKDSSILKEPAGRKNADNEFFTLGWMAALLVQEGVERCGSPCTDGTNPGALNSVLENGKPFDLAQLAYTPIVFTKSNHAGLTSLQFYSLISGVPKQSGEPAKTSTS